MSDRHTPHLPHISLTSPHISTRCLTGTPIQNSSDDLFALLRFLRLPKYGETLAAYKTLARHPDGLRALLDSLMLRRRKADFFNGKPILSLPPKLCARRATPFGSPDEAEGYAAPEEE